MNETVVRMESRIKKAEDTGTGEAFTKADMIIETKQ